MGGEIVEQFDSIHDQQHVLFPESDRAKAPRDSN